VEEVSAVFIFVVKRGETIFVSDTFQTVEEQGRSCQREKKEVRLERWVVVCSGDSSKPVFVNVKTRW